MTAARRTPVDEAGQRRPTPVPTRDYEGPPSIGVPTPGRPVAIGTCLYGTRYRIDRRIGEGGMGVVYEATHLDLDRRVALKLLRASGDARATERFAEEARAVCKLDSPYAVDVYDFERLPDGRAFIAMELLPRQTLAESLTEGPLDVERAIGLLRQVCKGLGAAHAAGIVHRDIKPENIAILEGQTGRTEVKILDFGIHAILDRKDGTVNARAAGTPAYQSPEACASLPVDVRSDIYSLGVTAYEMLAGRLPYDADEDDDDALLLAHVHDEVVPLSRTAAWVPRPLAEVVERCLEKSPEDRYADVADVEAALCEAQVAARLRTAWDDLPLPEVGRQRLEWLQRRMPTAAPRRARWPWALAAIVVLAIVAGVMAWAIPSAETESEITTLTNQARAAAARAYYVYPSPENPDEQTAYRVVLDLEELGWVGRERAGELRTEFADALARLGDRYWDEPGGRPFAADFYAEALIFDPAHERASARTSVTAGQIATLRDKAASATFNEGELVAAETLSVLAEEDDRERDKKLAALLASKRVRSVTVDAHLEQLASDEALAQRAAARDRDRPAEEPETSPRPRADATDLEIDEADIGETSDESGSESGEETEPVTIVEPEDERDEAVIAKQLADARRDLSKSRYALAVRGFEAVLAADPRSVAAMEGLAQASFERGDYNVAARFAAKAVVRRPRSARLHMLLGDAYYKTFRYRKALHAYREADGLGDRSASRAISKVEARLAERPD